MTTSDPHQHSSKRLAQRLSRLLTSSATLRQEPDRLTPERPTSEYLTREQAASFVTNEIGCPLSFSTATKLAALGEFAEPALRWGRRPLYTREHLRAWVEARGRKPEAA
jgi:hypothetical protein